jgi:hypothetical protein
MKPIRENEEFEITQGPFKGYKLLVNAIEISENILTNKFTVTIQVKFNGLFEIVSIKDFYNLVK